MFMPKFKVKQLAFVIIFCFFVIEKSKKIMCRPSKEPLQLSDKQYSAKTAYKEHALIKETRKNEKILNSEIFKSPLEQKTEKHRNGFGSKPNTAWEDVFEYTDYVTISSKMFRSRKNLSDDSYYVRSCIFNSLSESTSTPGGALSCYGSEFTDLLIESCSFISCHSVINCGAIYVYTGQCCLYKVCGYDCSTKSNSYNQFYYIQVDYFLQGINKISDSLISCSVNNNGGRRTITHLYGKINVTSINMSHNSCYEISGIDFFPRHDINFVMSYSSFISNTANTGGKCLYFDKNDDVHNEAIKCNIINNTQKDANSGIIHSCCNLDIRESCIFENDSPGYVLYAEYPYIVTLYSCIINYNCQTSGSVALTYPTIISSIKSALYDVNEGCNIQLLDVIDILKADCSKTCECRKQRVKLIQVYH